MFLSFRGESTPMIYIWKEAPFLRILAPFIIGILCGWYGSIPISFGIVLFLLTALCLLALIRKKDKHQHYRGWMTGVCFFMLFFSVGTLSVKIRMISNQPHWIGNNVPSGKAVELIVQEPLSEKQNVYKTLAKAVTIYTPKPVTANGLIWLYFNKKNGRPKIGYGTRLIVNQPLQPIRGSGNPGSFNYQQYALFKGITHQVFVQPNRYLILDTTSGNRFSALLFNTQEAVLRIIRQYIKGTNEVAVAEALLIGYRNDLDRDLIQAYSNTGVVHVIAISGMHLGLLYIVLLFITKPLSHSNKGKWIRFIGITTFLWFFSFLTGGGASVLRAALMFTCMSGGSVLGKSSSVYNSLAISAFFLLLVHPYYLWDVGFQLSYAAVLSIVIFMKPIHNLMLCKNQWIDKIWQLNAVTIAAQILTLPLCIYHFHQIPNLFLITNFIAVPLSSIILFGELALFAVAWHTEIALAAGSLLSVLLKCMNQMIVFMDQLPFAVTDGIRHNALQSISIYLMLLFCSIWLRFKKPGMLIPALVSLILFLSLKTIQEYQWQKQQKMIVYNISGQRAIELIQGRNVLFLGDTSEHVTKAMMDFHLKPAHIELGLCDSPLQTDNPSSHYRIGNKSVTVLNHAIPSTSGIKNIETDVLIVTGNPALSVQELLKSFNVHHLVFDNTNSPWKIKKWKAECAQLQLSCSSTAEEGAFVMNW